MRPQQASSALVVIAAAIMLGGCSTNFGESGGFREAMGLSTGGPDEFLVVSKAPLVVPPDMHLRPPQPGAPPMAAADPRAVARSSIAGAEGGAPVASGAASAGEAAILSRAGAHSADPAVREQLVREQSGSSGDMTVVDQVRAARREEAETLDAAREAERLRAEIAAGRQPVAGAPATGAPPPGTASGQPGSMLLDDVLGSPTN